MSNFGYDLRYKNCKCFWGTEPSHLVSEAIRQRGSFNNRKLALDIGCGEGKNCAALASAGYSVVGIDPSSAALANAKCAYPQVNVCWLQLDVRDVAGPSGSYDIVVATGSLHCLDSESEIVDVVEVMKYMTAPQGLNVISTFSDGSHDFSGHEPEFAPTLIGHSRLLSLYQDWVVLTESEVEQKDSHPDNLIEHHHTISRLLVSKSN